MPRGQSRGSTWVLLLWVGHTHVHSPPKTQSRHVVCTRADTVTGEERGMSHVIFRWRCWDALSDRPREEE